MQGPGQYGVLGESHRPPKDGVPAADLKARVLEELAKILDSPDFRNSHQSQRLLSHVVELSLEGRLDELRERVIGVELFGREAGFDTSDDPIVRVRANEVRKRLARYYEGLSAPPPVKLELHAGSYRVEFSPVGPEKSSPDSPSGAIRDSAPSMTREAGDGPANESADIPTAARFPRRTLLVAALCLVAAIITGAAWMFRAPEPIDEFWKPILAPDRRIIVCIGHPVVYRFSTQFVQKRRQTAVSFLEKQTEVLRFEPEESIHGKDIVPIEDQYIGLGSAHATAQIASWLSSHGRNPELRFGGDLSFTELKERPAVLVSFANRWTMDFMSGFRFVAELVDGKSLIRDRQTGKAWTIPSLQDNGKTDEDYVLISRTFYSESGQCLITIAGLTQYGTQAAGEIATNPSLLEPVLAKAGEGWQNRNLQLLFHVRVVKNTPGPPKLLAVHVW